MLDPRELDEEEEGVGNLFGGILLNSTPLLNIEITGEELKVKSDELKRGAEIVCPEEGCGLAAGFVGRLLDTDAGTALLAEDGDFVESLGCGLLGRSRRTLQSEGLLILPEVSTCRSSWKR